MYKTLFDREFLSLFQQGKDLKVFDRYESIKGDEELFLSLFQQGKDLKVL